MLYFSFTYTTYFYPYIIYKINCELHIYLFLILVQESMLQKPEVNENYVPS